MDIKGAIVALLMVLAAASAMQPYPEDIPAPPSDPDGDWFSLLRALYPRLFTPYAARGYSHSGLDFNPDLPDPPEPFLTERQKQCHFNPVTCFGQHFPRPKQ